MQELPEVETTLRGITPHLAQQTITQVVIRHHGLRWPIPRDMPKQLVNNSIQQLERRGKYLLLHLARGTLIIHLGMSGRLHVLTTNMPAQKHDHVDLILDNGKLLRFTDPRRFGVFLWIAEDPLTHVLLKNLGLEPLSQNFNGEHLWQRAQKKKIPVKTFIMDQNIVVGVGNIYANEALFSANIHPRTPASRISVQRYEVLASAIKIILQQAITQGGTTLKDFLDSDGKPGYFANYLHVYGREGEPCTRCNTVLTAIQLGERTTVFCECCQK